MRIIGHLDMDAFFAAVEERDKPRIKGLPVVVGSDPAPKKVLVRGKPASEKVWVATGRGVVSTANYKAREYGIHSALPISAAWELSQKAKREGKSEAVFLPVDFIKYEKISGQIMEIIRKFVPIVEEASIDEAYFDLSFCKSYGKAEELGQKIKDEIFKKEKLTCSVGIGPNKLISKISSGFKKPNGFTVVGSDDEAICAELVESFLEPMDIHKIPGIGPKTGLIFNQMGIKTIKELKKLSHSKMDELLGKWGDELYFKIKGIDEAPLVLDWVAKSIGEQETFLHDTKDANEVIEKVKYLAGQVFGRFKKSGFEGFKTVTVTVRFSDFETKSRAHTLEEPAKSSQILEFEALKLLLPFLDKRENPRQKGFRLLGVRVEKLY